MYFRPYQQLLPYRPTNEYVSKSQFMDLVKTTMIPCYFTCNHGNTLFSSILGSSWGHCFSIPGRDQKVPHEETYFFTNISPTFCFKIHFIRLFLIILYRMQFIPPSLNTQVLARPVVHEKRIVLINTKCN